MLVDTRAYQAVVRAQNRGELPLPRSLPCVDCGETARLYHHESYEPDRWLDVLALCRPCHKARHMGITARRRAAGFVSSRVAGIAVGRLREQRERRALSQDDLCKASGVAAATISRLETGRQRAQPRTVRKLADALGVAPAALYRGPEEAG